MNSNGILHLTVNEKGRVSLWDTPAAAHMGKQAGEVEINLSLTKVQIAQIVKAELMAASKERELKVNGF